MDSHPPLPALGPDDDDSTVHVTVQRRFSHFVFLHTALTRRLPGVALPPLPDKQYAGRFNDDFIEARRGDLERWLSRVVRHPLARYSEVLIFFLSCDNEKEWQQGIPRFLAPPPSPAASFYAHVYHPEFNVDEEDAQETVDKFERHLRVAGQGVQGLRGVFGKVREAGLEMSIAQRALSYSILAMITSTPLDQSPAGTTPSLAYSMTQWEDDEYDEDNKKGLVNDEGAWCWRDECEDCLERTKALQRMAETLQLVADAYDDHARRTQLAVHDALKDIAHPSALYAGVIDTHRSTLSRYTVASADVSSPVGDSHRVARCETVLNATMAEFDTYHTQKGEDIDRIAKDHLDSEIAFHEQVLKRLRTAREAFNTPPDPPPSGKAPTFKAVSPRPVPTPTTSASASFPQPLPPGPRQPSIYERDLAAAYTRAPAPLPQPTAHIYDGATTIRPVSSAVRDGVSMLFGGAGLKTGYAGLGSPTGVGGAGSSVGSPLGSPTSSTGGTSGGGMLPGLPLPAIPGLNRGSFDFGKIWGGGA
ncbi:hypothetical protein FRB99_001873 [Tulasnella sp. 403]|nr:hypothetical protein FRB99_001873 [Tulasnella sp. 403]